MNLLKRLLSVHDDLSDSYHDLTGGGQKRGIEVGRCVEARVFTAVNSNRHTHTCVSDAFVSGFALLGVLAKTRHFLVSVCLSVVWSSERNDSAPVGRVFMKFDFQYFFFFF